MPAKPIFQMRVSSDIEHKLAKGERRLDAMSEKAVHMLAKATLVEAALNVPVVTGTLHTSLRKARMKKKQGFYGWHVGSDARHRHLVEFGFDHIGGFRVTGRKYLTKGFRKAQAQADKFFSARTVERTLTS